MISPFKKYQTDIGLAGQLNRMMLNWNNAHPSDILAPRQPNPWTTFRGEKVYMQDLEYHDFVERAGKRALQMAGRVKWNFDSPTESDRQRLVRLVNKVRSEVRKRFIAELVRKRDMRVSHVWQRGAA